MLGVNLGGRRFTELASSKAGRSTSWALVSQVASLVASTANFLVLARVLGPAAYGLVAGSLALVLTVGPIANLGASKLAQRDIATKPDMAAAALTSAFLTVCLGGVASAMVLIAVGPFMLPQVPLALLLALALAELVASSIIGCCTGAGFAIGRPGGGTLASVLLSASKLVAVAVFAVTGGTDPVRWAALYAGLAVSAAALSAVLAFRHFGRPVVRGYRPLARAREGLPYSVNVTATVAQNDVDKTLLVRAGFEADAGHYSAAYRVATMAAIPVMAVLQAMLPSFFLRGHEGGIASTASLARRLAPPLLAYAVAVGGILLVGAPLLPMLLGPEYDEAVVMVMLLAPLTLFKVAQYVPSEALTGAGRQSTRMKCIIASTATNVVLNVVFIPRFGVSAAFVATFVSEALYVVLVNVAVRRALAEDRQLADEPLQVR